MANHSAHLLVINLWCCTLAVIAGDGGRSLDLFNQALDVLSTVDKETAQQRLFAFFMKVVREDSEDRVRFCSQFFDAISTRGMTDEFGFLYPIEQAVKYWQRGKDAEVLDRLNPEIREFVERIIIGNDQPPDTNPESRDQPRSE